MKTEITKWVLGGVAVVAVVVAVSLGSRYLLAPIKGVVEQQEITNKGAYRIQAYEQFYRWKEEIEATDVKIAAYMGRTDPRSLTECLGLVAVRADLASRYNAAARQRYTQGKWLADDLPLAIENRSKTCA